MLKEKVNAQTDGRTRDGQRAMTQARWPTASGAKKEKMLSTGKPFPPYIFVKENSFRKTLWRKAKLLKMNLIPKCLLCNLYLKVFK